MKKFLVSTLVAASILSMVGAASAHPHTITQTFKDATEFSDNEAYVPATQVIDGVVTSGYRVTVANGAGHPSFVDANDPESKPVYDEETGMWLYTSDDFDEYEAKYGGSAHSGYGMETAHHGPDLGTPGKADDAYVQDGPTGDALSPDDDNPALQ